MQKDEALKIVQDVLDPCSLDQFFDTIVGKNYMAILGDQGNDRHMLLGDDPKQAILSAYDRFPQNLTSHIHTPTVAPPSPRTASSPDDFQSLINEYHQKDYTIRIPDVTDISPRLSLFTRALEMIVDNPVGVVVFWSADEAKAPVHYDEVDVLIIQIKGTKKWYISDEPSPLPNAWKSVGEAEPTLGKYSTYDVAPGDLMYLPRGTVHTVHSTDESIHLAIGFIPVTVRDALTSVIDHLSDLDKPFREALGTRADDLSNDRAIEIIMQQVRAGLEKLTDNCKSSSFIEEALARRHEKMLLELPRLSPTMLQTPITINSKVRHNPLATSKMMVTPNIIDFVQPGERTLIHVSVEQSMQYIKDTPEFRVGDMAGSVGDDIRIALANKMLSTGFLEVVE